MYEVTQADVDAAIALARRAGRGYPGLADEFESVAMTGLYQASVRYTEGGDAPFRPYANHVIFCEIQDCVRYWKPRGYRGPSVTAEPPRSEPFVDADAGEDPVGWDCDFRDGVEGLARHLPASTRPIFVAYFCETPTLKAVGLRFGLCESRVSQIIIEARAILAACAINLRCEWGTIRPVPECRHGQDRAECDRVRGGE